MATPVTKTIKPSGGDYTTMAEAISLNFGIGGTNLVTADVQVTLDCYAEADTGGYCDFSGFTTNATHKIILSATGANRHTGSSGTGYRLRVPEWGTGILTAAFMDIIGIAFYDQNNDARVAIKIDWNANGIFTISHCLFTAGTNGYPAVTVLDQAISTLNAYNNVILNHSAGFNIEIGGAYNLYNNTIVSCGTGVNRTAGTVTVKNSLFTGCTADAAGTITDTYCATSNDNTKGLSAAGTGNRFSQTFTWNAGPPPYDLGATDAGARTYGLADPGSGLFSDDIYGTARGATWDIGADQVTAGAAGPTIPVLMSTYRRYRT